MRREEKGRGRRKKRDEGGVNESIACTARVRVDVLSNLCLPKT